MICAKCLRQIDAGAQRCPACKGVPTVMGRYRLDRTLHEDPGAVSYRATRTEDGMLVRAHALTLGQTPAPASAQLQALDHAALPRELDSELDLEHARLWLIREHIRGQTLAALLDAGAERVRDPGDALQILAAVADVLAYLHEQRPPVVHGRVSPQTILARDEARSSTTTGVVSLLDLSAMSAMSATSAMSADTGTPSPAVDVQALGRVSAALLRLDTSAWHPRQIHGLTTLIERMLAPSPTPAITSAEVRDTITKLRSSNPASTPNSEPRSPPTTPRPTTPAPRFMMLEPSMPGPARPRPTRPATTIPKRPLDTNRPRVTSRSLGTFHGHRAKPNLDIPVMRPEDLSRELSQAYQVTAALETRQRKRLGFARMLVVLIAATIAALTTYLAIGVP